MPIQPKCENCERKKGYTSDVSSGLCERCIVEDKPKKNKENEKE